MTHLPNRPRPGERLSIRGARFRPVFFHLASRACQCLLDSHGKKWRTRGANGANGSSLLRKQSKFNSRARCSSSGAVARFGVQVRRGKSRERARIGRHNQAGRVGTTGQMLPFVPRARFTLGSICSCGSMPAQEMKRANPRRRRRLKDGAHRGFFSSAF